MPHPKGSLAKRSWHGEAVTEGFTAGTFQKHRPMWKPATPESPRFCQRQNHPPLARGALVCISISTAVTIPGTGGAVTIRRRFPCALSAATRRRNCPRALPAGSLAKGSWHGEAVTEGFTAGTFQKHRPMWKPATLGIPPVLPEAKPPPFGKGGLGLCIH